MMAVRHYLAIARPDHWFKNVFMLLGVALAFFVDPGSLVAGWQWNLLFAVAATCLVASSNYVLNEILDAPQDLLHPTKKSRPVPSGRISLPIAWAEWLVLAASGFGVAALVNPPFTIAAATLWVAGICYNVRPLRTKDIPYVDVLTESLNNPIRLFLGWFALLPREIPPISLVVAYWMAGAFFMGTKRFAEYRHIGAEAARGYRPSFRHYDENRLLLSLVFYTAACSLFLGIFIVRYHLELILGAPLFAGFFVYYLRVGLRANSVVQNPEKLYRERGLMVYTAICLAIFVALLFVRIPPLYDLFKVAENAVVPLWVY